MPFPPPSRATSTRAACTRFNRSSASARMRRFARSARKLRWRKEVQQRIQELNEEMAAASVGPLLEELREGYRDHPRAVEHINAIQKDVTEDVNALIGQEARSNGSMASVFSRYQANLLVDNAEQQGAPVVYEDMPTYQHLVGRVEHQVHQGALLTDFRLIRAGALHRANGGYLILDAVKVLTQPFVWESLKRALYEARVKIESLEQLYSLASTVSLEPEPMPLDLKIVLIGNRMRYYLLCAYDPDFLELFKVQADLEEDVQRDADTQQLYARLLAPRYAGESAMLLSASLHSSSPMAWSTATAPPWPNFVPCFRCFPGRWCCCAARQESDCWRRVIPR